MLLTILKSKIHRAVVTQADLNYTGSITIDKTLMEAAAIYEYEKVLVVNINNGERFETYAIEGDADSGIICLNGACARLAQIGDKIIILSFLFMNKEAYINHSPIKIYVDDDNSILA